MSPEAFLLALRLALALALYAFLGLILQYLRRDVRSAVAAGGGAPQAYLQWEAEDGVSRAYLLASVNLLGRAADNSIVLDQSTVSAHHARLTFQQGQWWLEDQGSKNGTGVNELDVQEPLVVTFGDRIRIGSVQLVLRSGPVPDEVAPTQDREPEALQDG